MDRDNHVLYGSFDGHYVTMTRGDGVYVYDGDGNRYLDAVGGVCVVNIGHGVQEIIDAINKQAAVLTYTYGGIVDNEPRQMHSLFPPLIAGRCSAQAERRPTRGP